MRGTLPQRSFCWRGPRGTPSFTAPPARRASPAPHCAAPSAWDGASLATVPLLWGDPPSEHPPQGCRTVPPQHPKLVETCSGDVVPLHLVIPSCFRGSHLEVPSFLQAPSGAQTSSRAGSRTSKGSAGRAEGSSCSHTAASPPWAAGSAPRSRGECVVAASRVPLAALFTSVRLSRQHGRPRPAKPTRGWDAASAARESRSRGRCAAISSEHKPIASPAVRASRSRHQNPREPSAGRRRADVARNGAKQGAKQQGAKQPAPRDPRSPEQEGNHANAGWGRLRLPPASPVHVRGMEGRFQRVVERGSPDHLGRSLALSARRLLQTPPRTALQDPTAGPDKGGDVFWESCGGAIRHEAPLYGRKQPGSTTSPSVRGTDPTERHDGVTQLRQAQLHAHPGEAQRSPSDPELHPTPPTHTQAGGSPRSPWP